MRKLEHALLISLVLGCARPPSPASSPEPRERPGAGGILASAPTTTAQVEMEPICRDGYSGPYRGFLEDAQRPIATVLLGHYVYSDDRECHLDAPRKPIVSIALPRATFHPRGREEARILSGDPLRPLLDEECTHVIACDDQNGNGACDLPAEPMLNGYNDRSRYLHASVSRPARFRLTMTSRDDRSCRGTNYYSRCCPDGYVHYQDTGTCSGLSGNRGQIPARCP